MNKTKRLTARVGFAFGTVLLGVVLTGCVGYVDAPRQGAVYVQPPPVYVDAPVVVQPDYVYYPSYQVYYSSHTRQYVYPEGRSWVSRPAPPHVSASVLLASPSVRLDFRDHPSIHHATVVQQYPRNWAPAGSNHGRQEGQPQRQ